jgi:integrase
VGFLYRPYRKINGKKKFVSRFIWAQWRDHTGKRCRESTGCLHDDVVGARRWLRGREVDSDRDLPTAKVGRRTVKQGLEAVMADKQLHGRRWLAEPRRMIDQFLVPHFGASTKLTTITTATVRAYAAKRRASGAAGSAINMETGLLKRAFNIAAADGDVLSVPKFEKLPENPPRTGFVTRADFDKIVRQLPPYLRAALTVLYILGWRRGEVLRMTPDQIDVNRNTITIEVGRSKSGKKREVAMPPEVRTIIQKQLRSIARLKKEGVTCKWVFHLRRGGRIDGFKRRWRTACTKAGHEGLKVHDLRRSAARNLIDAGVDKQLAMEFLGQSTPSIFDRYRIIDATNMQQAAVKLDEFFKRPKPTRGVVREFKKRAI